MNDADKKMNKLDIKNLTKIYPHPKNPKIKIPILSSISFNCNSSKLNYIIGESGSGKTTLLNIIRGYLPFDAGDISYNDNNLQLLNRSDFKKIIKEIVYFNQIVRLNIDFNLNVVENLKYNFYYSDENKNGANKKINNLLKKLKLEGIKDNPIKFLSGGELQRLSLAKSIILKPKILLLDEPFSNVDPEGKMEMVGLLRDVLQIDETVIIIATHDLDIIKKNDFKFDLINKVKY